MILIGASASSQATPTEVVANTVTSARLEAVLKAGPHAMIRAFYVEPAYHDKRFLGFKVVARTPHPVIEEQALIKVGDIVVAANGIRLETPAQFMAAWRKLREVSDFSVQVLRASKPIEYRWKLQSNRKK
tara:strand:- start:100 stop:489 length:390 start_codon:yes stop_codon:yes gene_type:complete